MTNYYFSITKKYLEDKYSYDLGMDVFDFDTFLSSKCLALFIVSGTPELIIKEFGISIIKNIKSRVGHSENDILEIIAYALRKAFFEDIKIFLEKPFNYSDYLKSDHWQKMRKLALSRAKYKCQLCSTKNVKLNVHHNTYENLGNEKNEDLIVLCENCHKKFHNK